MDEISAFMDRHPTSYRSTNDKFYLEAFCKGASFLLDNSNIHALQNFHLAHIDEPKAWVSDRNYWLSQDGAAVSTWYGNVLGRHDLYKVLQNERFRDNSAGEMIGPPRQLFISNPDGASVLAILRTAPHAHVDGLRDLLANYIQSSPAPNLTMRVSNFWNKSFVINITLPFFAISPSSMQDKRIFNTSKHRFRARYRLDSLNLQDPRSRLGCGQSYSFQDKLVLHEAVFAMTTTGPSERHWTTYCFDEHFFADEPRLEGEDEDEDEQGEEEEDDEDDEEDDDEEPPANIDPILTEPELNVNSWLPRQYSLVALATQLERISGYHSDVHEVFKHNLDLYMASAEDGIADNIYPSVKQDWKGFPELLGRVIFCNMNVTKEIDNFLETDIQLCPNGLPQGVLWQSLRTDVRSLKSLEEIKTCRNRLRALGGKLEQIKESFEELRRGVSHFKLNHSPFMQ
ncbi:Ff.00g088590.m01.CDS01 [Fusarium sp. VM40]|nr:Ff.00g088590.m01.CDS01 [Fusarium sp. VM40]